MNAVYLILVLAIFPISLHKFHVLSRKKMVVVWRQLFLCQICVTFLFPDGCFHFLHPVNLTVNLLYSLLLPTYMPPNPKKEEHLPKTPICFSWPFSNLNGSKSLLFWKCVCAHPHNSFIHIFLFIDSSFIHSLFSRSVVHSLLDAMVKKTNVSWCCSMDLPCHSESVKVTLGQAFK